MLNPLYARALVLRGDSGSFALVTLNLGRPFDPVLLDSLRRELEETARLDAVLFSASHTHAAPSVQRAALEAGPGLEWARWVFDRIRDTVWEANTTSLPMRIGCGAGTSWIANNRRHVRRDGSVQMISRDSPKFRNPPIDPAVRVLRVDRADGSPLAVLVHYACHPVALGNANLNYSADWPGSMMRTIEEEVPGRPMAIFLQGASGDINLVEPLAGKSGETKAAQIGQAIGTVAGRIARSIQTGTIGKVDIRCATRELAFQSRWNYDELMARAASNPGMPIGVFKDGYARY